MNEMMQMRAKLEGLSVLIVEDEPTLREGTKILFGKFFNDVEGASHADEALACFDAKRYDLVVSDLKMPGRSGIQLAAALKERFPDVLFVILTGDPDEKCDDASVDIVLKKPATLEDIKRVLQRLIARHGR